MRKLFTILLLASTVCFAKVELYPLPKDYTLFCLGLENYQQDNKQAFFYFTKAASLGNGPALYFLGQMYGFGEQVKKDMLMAKVYYILAAMYSHPQYGDIVDTSYLQRKTPLLKMQMDLVDKKKDLIKGNLIKRSKLHDPDDIFWKMEDITNGDKDIKWEGK